MFAQKYFSNFTIIYLYEDSSWLALLRAVGNNLDGFLFL